MAAESKVAPKQNDVTNRIAAETLQRRQDMLL